MLVSDLPPALYLGFAFVFGATWGSFFNVAIYRWPRELSVVSPPSTCPACGTRIPAARNVPILAYLLQRGRAACCGAKLTPRYVVVELLSALLLTALTQRFVVHAEEGTTLASACLETATWFVFVGGLIVATFVDLEWMEIPDEVTIGGTALGLATLSLRPEVPALEAALGAGAGYLVVQLLLVWSWERWTGRRGMGEGDAKLMLFIGIFCGWHGAVFALVAGAVQGLLAVLVGHLGGRPITTPSEAAAKNDATAAAPPAPATPAERPAATEPAPSATAADADAKNDPAPDAAAKNDPETPAGDADADVDPGGAKVPFGPFLALAAVEYLFFGEAFLDWYSSQFL